MRVKAMIADLKFEDGRFRVLGSKFIASILLLSLLSLAFIFEHKVESAPASSPLIMVYDRGSMQEIYKDNAAAKVNLTELKNTEHLYALGPLSKLRGEIIIWDSVPHESRISAGQMQVKSDWNESAAYLVWASVPKWRKIKVPPAVLDINLFESWLYSMSGKEEAPLRGQYPFLLKGRFNHLLWHVVNEQDDGKPLTPAKHQAQKFHGHSRDIRAEIVGFYSPDHQGLFIPKGRRTHMHVQSGDDLLGHVDEFEPKDEGLTLYVPSR